MTQALKIHIGILVTVATLTACFPPAVSMDGDSSSEDGDTGSGSTGDTGSVGYDGLGLPDMGGDGDGDGDSAAVDLAPPDECTLHPVAVTNTPDQTWASSDSWTAFARAIEQDEINANLEIGAFISEVIIGGHQCWELQSGQHSCVVNVCGVLLLGQPMSELLVQPAPECDFMGPWDATDEVSVIDGDLAGACIGIIDGVAIEILAAA